MWKNQPRSLPDWIENGYKILVSQTTNQQEGITNEQAQELLLVQQSFPDEPADAQYAIERLLNYGWLYEAEGKLRITDPEH
jgi:hypothetical protein